MDLEFFLVTRSGQMVDHRADLFKIKRSVNKAIDARIDGFFEEGVLPLRNDEKDSWPAGLLNVAQQSLFFNSRTIDIQDEDIETFMGKVRFDLITAI